MSSLRDRRDPARAAMREAGRIRADAATPEYAAAALDRLMEWVHARDPATMADIRQYGFHEVLRTEKLRLLAEESRP